MILAPTLKVSGKLFEWRNFSWKKKEADFAFEFSGWKVHLARFLAESRLWFIFHWCLITSPSYNQWQKLWEKLVFGQFRVSTPFPPPNNVPPPNKICVKLCYAFATLYKGRGGFLNIIFKISITFCYWLSEI